MEGQNTRRWCLLVILALGCTTARADLVQDGDFSNSIPGSEEYPAEFSVSWQSTNSPAIAPYEDEYGNFVALFAEELGTGDLALRQTVGGLTVGASYDLLFELSILSAQAESDSFEVLFGGHQVYFWENTAGYPATVPLALFQEHVTAGAESALLEFKSHFDGIGYGPDEDAFTYITLDNVALVPLPPSVVLAGMGMMSYVACSGFAAFGTRFLNHKRKNRRPTN